MESIWRACSNKTNYPKLEDNKIAQVCVVGAGITGIMTAYELVQKIAMQSWDTKTPFPDLVKADEQIQKVLSPNVLSELFNPQSFLVYEDTIFNRVLQ